VTYIKELNNKITVTSNKENNST